MSDSAEIASTAPAGDALNAAQWRPLVLAVLLLALFLRLIAAVALDHHVSQAGRSFFIEGDANGYWDLGLAVARGEDYAVHTPPRRVLRVPGFPLLLAGSIRVFGENIFAARCVLAVVGAACCWFTYLLGSRLVMRRVGFWAALMMAVHPWQVGNSVLILSENWFTFWMLLSLLGFVTLLNDPRGSRGESLRPDGRLALRAGGTGLLLAAAVLVRPGFIPWLIVAAGAVLLNRRLTRMARTAAAGGLVIGFVLGMLPWGVRNYAVTGHPVLTSLWSGPSLYDGLNPEADGSSKMEFFERDNVMAEMSEYNMNAHYQRLAGQYAANHPRRVIELAGLKLMRFLQPLPNSISGGWDIWAVCVAGAAAFVGLSVIGLKSRMLDSSGLLVVLGPFLLFLVVHMVFVGSLRYRLPAEFPLSVLVATGLQQWLPGRQQA